MPGLEGYTGDQRAFALPFFNERLQEMREGLVERRAHRPNPYTGVPLVRDPTLAFVEI